MKNNSKMGNGIYLKIAGYVDLAVLIIFTPCQISDIINGFWVITEKPAILSYRGVCSFYSHSGHVVWCTASSDTNLKLDTLVMIQTKFGFNWSSSFRGEDFWNSLQRTTDGRQVMAKAHMAFGQVS